MPFFYIIFTFLVLCYSEQVQGSVKKYKPPGRPPQKMYEKLKLKMFRAII